MKIVFGSCFSFAGFAAAAERTFHLRQLSCILPLPDFLLPQTLRRGDTHPLFLSPLASIFAAKHNHKSFFSPLAKTPIPIPLCFINLPIDWYVGKQCGGVSNFSPYLIPLFPPPARRLANTSCLLAASTFCFAPTTIALLIPTFSGHDATNFNEFPSSSCSPPFPENPLSSLLFC